jgi:RHS repeat-associated protein
MYVTGSLRQKFTGQERDAESGLDYFLARCYASGQGRFTSVDPLLASARAGNPQSWNRYAYVINNPLRLVDPSGMSYFVGGSGAADPFIPEYRMDGFEQSPDGTFSNLNTEDMAGIYAQFDDVASGAATYGQKNDKLEKPQKPLTDADVKLAIAEWIKEEGHLEFIAIGSLNIINNNNLSEGASSEVILCLAWNETTLGVFSMPAKSRFKGPMNLGGAEAKSLGYTSEQHLEMASNPALGYQGGTRYLGRLLKANNGDLTWALQDFRGRGKGSKDFDPNHTYATKIMACANKVAAGDLRGGLFGLKLP